MHNPPWHDLVDVDRLTAWMDANGLGEGIVDELRLLTGGTQNLLLHLRRSGQHYVLRRPPAHPRFDGNTTIEREARVLAALANTAVPHARLVARCEDPSVLGASFYLMASIDGFTPTGQLPGRYAVDAERRHAIGLAMVDGIAALARVNPTAVGLSNFGKLDGWIERQVPRWRKQLVGYRDFAGWPGPAALPDAETLATWLDKHRPASMVPGIVHGDFHLGNVMVHHERPELAAIVDWELASLGDPLFDLGWLLATWPGADGKTVVGPLAVQPWTGFAGASELTERYAQSSRRDLSDLPWFVVLACYKLGIILEGTHARACAGQALPEIGQALHQSACALFERGMALIDGQLP